MGVKLAAASGGSIELVPTNTASAFTVTVPAVTGTMALQNGAGVGKVLQVIQTTSSTQVSNSSTTFVSTGLSQSITPSSSTSKILIMTYCPLRFGSSNSMQAGIRINKNSGTILMTDTIANNVATIVDISYPISLNYLDSPATTSPITYTIEFNTTTAASPYAYPTINYTGYSHLSTLTLMEIAG